MTKMDIDKFAVERHLVTLNGLAQALAIMAQSADLEEQQQEGIGGMADAIEGEFKALWGLVFSGDFPRAGDPKEGQS